MNKKICVQCKQKYAIKDRVRCKLCLFIDREYRKNKREIEKNERIIIKCLKAI